MNKPPIKKPQALKGPPTGYHKVDPAQTAASSGERYRVRDKDWDTVWGDNLTFDEANKLKEQVIGQRKSRTARVEPCSVEPPDWYIQAQGELADAAATGNDALAIVPPPAPTPTKPERAKDTQLQNLRAGALAASRGAATDAQRRHDHAAARDRSSQGAAKNAAKRAPTPEPPRPVPVVSTVNAGEEDPDELGFKTLDPSELSNTVSSSATGLPSRNDVVRAQAQAKPAPVKPEPPKTAEVVTRAKYLYEVTAPDPKVAWEELNPTVQRGWREEAHKHIKAGTVSAHERAHAEKLQREQLEREEAEAAALAEKQAEADALDADDAGEIDVTDHGAVGDGATNYAPAVSELLDMEPSKDESPPSS